jgi:hypothetical protein
MTDNFRLKLTFWTGHWFFQKVAWISECSLFNPSVTRKLPCPVKTAVAMASRHPEPVRSQCLTERQVYASVEAKSRWMWPWSSACSVSIVCVFAWAGHKSVKRDWLLHWISMTMGWEDRELEWALSISLLLLWCVSAWAGEVWEWVGYQMPKIISPNLLILSVASVALGWRSQVLFA